MAVIKHNHQRQLEEERAYFTLQLYGCSLSLREVKTGTQGKNLVAGTEAEAL